MVYLSINKILCKRLTATTYKITYNDYNNIICQIERFVFVAQLNISMQLNPQIHNDSY